MADDGVLRKHLVAQLNSDYAHVSFRKAIGDWPAASRGTRPSASPHSAWELLEHLRIAQWDILEFSRNPEHVSPEWPEGYWPSQPVPPDDAAWAGSIDQFERDLQAMQALIADRRSDLYTPFPHGTGQNLLKESLTLASHNSYHIGQLMVLKRMMAID